jgi:hypothetical protein
MQHHAAAVAAAAAAAAVTAAEAGLECLPEILLANPTEIP